MGNSSANMGKLPEDMMCVRFNKFLPKGAKTAEDLSNCVEIVRVPIPACGADQVLIRVHHSPINPADLAIAAGSYGGTASAKQEHSNIPGTEGSGVVVGVGPGVSGMAIGKRVTFYARAGAWAEYVACDTISCIPLPDDVKFEEGCNSFANPVSVVAFIQLAKAGGHHTIVHTAAASALGKMLIAYGKQQGIGVVGVVRKKEQAEEILALGAKSAVILSDADIDEAVSHFKHEALHDEKGAEELKGPIKVLDEALKTNKVTLGFDAVGGNLTGLILKFMQQNGTLYVYGGLAGQPCGFINPQNLIIQSKKVLGFWAIQHVRSMTKSEKKLLAAHVLGNVRKGQSLHTAIKQEFPLSKGTEAILAYLNDTSGKFVIVPGADREAKAKEAAAAAAAPAAASAPAAAAAAEQPAAAVAFS